MPEKTDQRPMAAYATLLGVYGLSMLGLVIGRNKAEQQAERWTAGDIALLGAATFKLSRLVTKARVTAPLREPFAKPGASVGEGEVSDEPVGHGLQRAIGELLTCPFCGSAWIAMGLTYGLILAPRLTRRAMSIATALALSDTLHLSFSAASSIAERLEQPTAGN